MLSKVCSPPPLTVNDLGNLLKLLSHSFLMCMLQGANPFLTLVPFLAFKQVCTFSNFKGLPFFVVQEKKMFSIEYQIF